jgi:hypothetical protein
VNDADQNEEKDKVNIELSPDEENTNPVVVDGTSITEQNEENEEKGASTGEEGQLGKLFKGVNEENVKELELNNNKNSDTSLGYEINDENLNSPSENQAVDNVEISTITNDVNEDIANTLKKPGDDIKFYEPGDMIPEFPLGSSGDVISDNDEDSNHQKESNNLEADHDNYKTEEKDDGKIN